MHGFPRQCGHAAATGTAAPALRRAGVHHALDQRGAAATHRHACTASWLHERLHVHTRAAGGLAAFGLAGTRAWG